jgi:tetratricopeptide (TPR) repeat protein
MLGSVGRFDAALQQALAALEIDPSSAVINSRVAIVYTWINDVDQASEYFERSDQLGAAGSTYLLAKALALARQGKAGQARDLTNAGISIGGGTTDWIDPVFAALADPGRRDVALAALDLAASDERINPQVEVTVRMMLGDTDGALTVARMLVQPGQTFEMELLFLPEFMPLRERPEFLELMEAMGVTDYWEEVGCVWENLAVVCS